MEKFIPDPARLQAVEENWKQVLDRVQEGAVKKRSRSPRGSPDGSDQDRGAGVH